MVSAEKTFRSLSRERYLAPDWFDREMAAIHHRQWLYGCHLSEIPVTGSFVLRNVAPYESLVIVRTGDDAVRAFFNVCRHRGSRICDDEAGELRALRCPYHNWTYDLDGRLLRAPHVGDGDGFSYADFGLDQAHVEVWQGHVFVNLDTATPVPLAPQLDAAAPTLGAFQPLRTKVAIRHTYPIEANWKLVMENFWECYHCQTGHPQFCYAADVGALNDSDFTDIADPDSFVPLVIEGPLPLKPAMRTLSMDGSLVSSRLLGDFPLHPEAAGRGPTAGFLLRHCTAATYFVDHAILLDFQPVSVSRTDLVMRWFVHEEAVEGRDYLPKDVMAVFDITNRQDRELSERNQAGVQSVRYRPGPNSFIHEAGVHEFHRFCDQCLAAAV